MTRETKVGLLAGMALILLIGILVSDHLSVGQKDPASGLGDFASENQLAPPTRSTDTPARLEPVQEQQVDRGTIHLPEEVIVERSPSREQPQQAEDAPTPASSGTQVVRRPAEEERQGLGLVLPSRMPSASRKWHTVRLGESLSGIARIYYGEDGLWTVIQKANPDTIGREGEVREGARIAIPELEATNALGDSRNNRPEAGEGAARRAGTITVKAGQTLGELAQIYLGSSAYANLLFEANRHILKDPDTLRVGMVLRLPARPQIVRRTVAPVAGENPATYTVQPGDTMSSIATEMLGKSSQWRRLYQANRRVIRDPDVLAPGTKLTIPRDEI